jgi:subtilisin-like proprotein convertase family protein
MTFSAVAREGEPPKSFSQNLSFETSKTVVELPAVNVNQLLQKHQYQPGEAKPLRFAVPNEVSFDPRQDGQWLTIEEGPYTGDRIWQMRFSAKNATDMNFGLSQFHLPKGVELHFISYADSPAYYDGPYTHQDNRKYNEFWSAPLPGGEVGIELYVPKSVSMDDVQLAIGRVSSGFRDVFKRYGGDGLRPKQGSCNNDVVCPVGDPWRDEIRSVAAYTVGGVDTCTGTMIMDADRTFTPFFVTAYHCGLSTGNAASVVTIWNYESENCGDLSGGSRLDTVSGAIYRASREDVDSSLIELASVPPEDYNVYWAGWDRSGVAPQGSVGIHHPGVDEKAISFNDDALTTRSSCILSSGPAGTHWNVDNWEDGTTEPGSSGSGLWDPDNHRLVGFLSGGQAACGNSEYDCYGRFSVAWDNGGSDNVNFKPWLDPNDSGVTFVDGSNPNPFSLTVADSTIAVCQADDAQYSLDIALSDNQFNESITLSAVGLPAGASHMFSNNPVTAPATSLLTVGNTASVAVGSYDFTVNGQSVSASSDESLTLIVDAAVPAQPITLVSPTDGAVNVDTVPQLSWNDVADANEYLVEMATDAGFTNIVVNTTVTGNSFTPSQILLPNTMYYWRVTPINGCGSGQASSVFSFTTNNEICINGPISIPDGDPNGEDVVINVSESGSVEFIKVTADISHTYVGDLSIELSHLGTDVMVMERPGNPASTYGCSENDVVATFDDNSAIAVETECSTTPPAIGGILKPEQPLIQFIGLDLTGDWTFNVSDAVGQDTGVVNQLCLIPIEDLIFENSFE